MHRYAFDLENYLKIYQIPIPKLLAYFMKKQMPGMVRPISFSKNKSTTAKAQIGLSSVDSLLQFVALFSFFGCLGHSLAFLAHSWLSTVIN